MPFVWSDQYDRKIQTVGVVSADAEVHVAHGSLAERQFVALFGRDGRLVGALGFNRAAPGHAVPQADRRARDVGTPRCELASDMSATHDARADCCHLAVRRSS